MPEQTDPATPPQRPANPERERRQRERETGEANRETQRRLEEMEVRLRQQTITPPPLPVAKPEQPKNSNLLAVIIIAVAAVVCVYLLTRGNTEKVAYAPVGTVPQGPAVVAPAGMKTTSEPVNTMTVKFIGQPGMVGGQMFCPLFTNMEGTKVLSMKEGQDLEIFKHAIVMDGIKRELIPPPARIQIMRQVTGPDGTIYHQLGVKMGMQ